MNPAPRRPRSRRANFAIVATMLSVLLGFTSMVVDLGMLRMANVQLQAAVDASALAGTAYLDGTSLGVTNARNAAKTLLDNRILGESLSLQDADIVTGVYDFTTGTFTESTDPLLINALTVDYLIDDIDVFFDMWNLGTLSTSATAVSAQPEPEGAGSVDCYLPIAIPDCVLTDPDAEDLILRFNSDKTDNTAWGRSGGSTPSASWVSAQLVDNCADGPIDVGGELTTNNGVITSSLQQVQDLLEDSTTTWDTSKWGPQPSSTWNVADPAADACAAGGGSPSGTQSSFYKSTACGGGAGGCWGRVIAGVAVLINSGGQCGCTHHFNKTSAVTGMVYAVIYDVNATGADKNIRIHLDLTNEYPLGTEPGPLDTNVTYEGAPILVE